MRGIPNHCNTKKDYEFLIANYSEDIWRPALQALYDDRVQLFNRGVLKVEDAGVVDDTHSIVEETDMVTGEVIRYQYEEAVSPTAYMFRIGYTVAEVEGLLNAI